MQVRPGWKEERAENRRCSRRRGTTEPVVMGVGHLSHCRQGVGGKILTIRSGLTDKASQLHGYSASSALFDVCQTTRFIFGQPGNSVKLRSGE